MKQFGYGVTVDGTVVGTTGVPFSYAQESAQRYRGMQKYKGKVIEVVPVFFGSPGSAAPIAARSGEGASA